MHPLSKKITHLTRQAQRTTAATAVARVMALAVGTTLGLMLLDYVLRLTDPGMRWLFASVLMIALAAATARWLWPMAWKQITPLSIAQRLQHQSPELGSRLASALEFLGQSTDSPAEGSTDLRRAVVIQATSQLEQVSTQQVIDRKPLHQALRGMLVVLVGLMAFGVADPAGLQTAAARLLTPWSQTPWPRQHYLQLAEVPSRLARGQSLDVTVSDLHHTRLPSDLRVQYRTRVGGETRREEQPLPATGDSASVLRENVQQSFSFRVVGGDDESMKWHQVQVVDPPAFEKLVVQLSPASYTGLPPRTLREEDRVLAGGQVAIEVQPEQAILSAELELLDSNDKIKLLPLQKDESNAKIWRLPTPWKLATDNNQATTITYRVAIESSDGLVNRSPARTLRVEPDPAPKLEWLAPTSDPMLTSQALVPIRALAEDNLAMQAAELHWQKLKTQEPPEDAQPSPPVVSKASLLQGPANPPQRKNVMWGVPGDSQELAYELDLATLELSPGDQLQLQVLATDYRPGTGRTTHPRRVHILSEEEFDARLAAQQTELLQNLKRLLADQRTTRQSTGELHIAGQQQTLTAPQAVDRLATLGFDQQRINQGIQAPGRGAIQQAEIILAQLEQNRLDRPELASQIDNLREQLSQLAEQELDQAARQLAAARRRSQQSVEDATQPLTSDFVDSLAQATQSQDQAIESLENLVEQMSGWSDFQRFARELAELEQRQRKLREQTLREAARGAAAGKDNPEREAERSKLRAQQAELARRFGKLQDAMRRAARQSEDSSQASSQALRDALSESQDRATRGKLNDAERQLRLGQLGMSAEQQQQAADDMQEMRNTLRDQASSDPKRLAEQLQNARQKLQALQQELQKLQQRAKQPAQQRQREKLADRTERLGRQLDRLNAPQAAQSAQQGAGQMQQSAEEGEQGRQSLNQAQQSLQKAQQQLAEKIKELKDLLALKVLDRLAQRLPGYIQRQSDLLQGTIRAQQEAAAGIAAQDRHDPSNQLAKDQQQLQVEIDVARRNVADREVFELALRGVADQMQQAAQRLAQAQVDRTTQQREYSAWQRLKHVSDALKLNPPEPEANPQQGAAGQGGQNGGQQKPPSPIDVAELKMLRLMQLDLNAKTRQLESDAAEQQWPANQAAEAAQQLSTEQAKLQALVQELLQRQNAPPPAPGELPDDAV